MPPAPSGMMPRRAYKRYSAEVWKGHKDTIRELFLDQDKTYGEVATVLRTEHDFDIGVRQLKRWTDEWGFFKNIPDRDMRKMARKRQRRQEQLGRPTKFTRRHGGGEFQEVPASKLDAYQKRFGAIPGSPESESSSLPSNIRYGTPTDFAPSPPPASAPAEPSAASATAAADSSTPPSTSRGREDLCLEFNAAAEAVFNNASDSDRRAVLGASLSLARCHSASLHKPISSSSATLPPSLPILRNEDASASTTLLRQAFDDGLAGRYRAAARAFARLADSSPLPQSITTTTTTITTTTPSNLSGGIPIQVQGGWPRAVLRFHADVLEAASYPGYCPQSLVARVLDILACFLVRERERYAGGRSDIVDVAEEYGGGDDGPEGGMGKGKGKEKLKEKELEMLRGVLSAVNVGARFWGSVVMHQRVLRIWEPILGREHPKMVLVRDFVEFLAGRGGPEVGGLGSARDDDLAFRERLVRFADAASEAFPLENFESLPTLQPVIYLIHLGDGPTDRLLERLQATERELKPEIAQLRLGRARALMGVYSSFIYRFTDADEAFAVSEQHMQHESCVEFKLHRILWHAEHKTRVGDWAGVRPLMDEAHKLFMANDEPSEFVVDHFSGRFSMLCSAVSAQLPIDKMIDTIADPDMSDHGSVSTLSDATAEPRLPALSLAVGDSTGPQERLFPTTPRGAHAEIDVDAWRQSVDRSSA